LNVSLNVRLSEIPEQVFISRKVENTLRTTDKGRQKSSFEPMGIT